MQSITYHDGRKTLVRVVPEPGSKGDLGFYGTGVAVCGHDDHFDAEIGEAIATGRAFVDYGNQLVATAETNVITKERYGELLLEMFTQHAEAAKAAQAEEALAAQADGLAQAFAEEGIAPSSVDVDQAARRITIVIPVKSFEIRHDEPPPVPDPEDRPAEPARPPREKVWAERIGEVDATPFDGIATPGEMQSFQLEPARTPGQNLEAWKHSYQAIYDRLTDAGMKSKQAASEAASAATAIALR